MDPGQPYQRSTEGLIYKITLRVEWHVLTGRGRCNKGGSSSISRASNTVLGYSDANGYPATSAKSSRMWSLAAPHSSIGSNSMHNVLAKRLCHEPHPIVTIFWNSHSSSLSEILLLDRLATKCTLHQIFNHFASPFSALL